MEPMATNPDTNNVPTLEVGPLPSLEKVRKSEQKREHWKGFDENSKDDSAVTVAADPNADMPYMVTCVSSVEGGDSSASNTAVAGEQQAEYCPAVDDVPSRVADTVRKDAADHMVTRRVRRRPHSKSECNTSLLKSGNYQLDQEFYSRKSLQVEYSAKDNLEVAKGGAVSDVPTPSTSHTWQIRHPVTAGGLSKLGVSSHINSDISMVKRSLSMRALLEISKLEGREATGENLPKPSLHPGAHNSVHEAENGEPRPPGSEDAAQYDPDVPNRPLMIHVDINKTITMSDTVMNKSVEYTIRECVAATFWGTIKYPELDKPAVISKIFSTPSMKSCSSSNYTQDLCINRQMTGTSSSFNQSHGPRWMWDGTKPRLRPEGDYVSYLQFCRDVLSEKDEQRSSIRSFNLVQHLNCRKLMEDLVAKTVAKMTMPEECRGEAAREAGLSGDWLNTFPSFFELIAWLQLNGRPFSVLFRSFGNDLERVRTEWNAFCEGRHPVYAKLVDAIGPMDGTQPGVPDRRIHASDSHTLYRDAHSPCLALGVSTNGVFEGAWDQWGRSKVEEDTRDGRKFLRELTHTVEGYQNLRQWMKDMARANKCAAIKDDFAWWHHCGEISSAGKLMFAIPEIAQVFFDDNAGGPRDDAKIIDCRYGDPSWTINHELGDGSLYAQVSPIDAILHDQYFIKLLIKCEENQRACWSKIQQQCTSSESLYQETQVPRSLSNQQMVSKQQSSLSGGIPAIALAFRDLRLAPLLGDAIKIQSSEALKTLLEEHSVDISVFGTKQYKTIDALFQEVQTGKCSLESFVKDNGTVCLRRVLQVVLVKVYFRDKILVETHEQMVDGRLRSRHGFLPGAKKRTDESFVDCMRRWMVEEVQFDFDLLCAVDERGTFEEYEEAESISYPVRCRYYRYTVCYKLDERSMDDELMERIGLPSGTMFVTTEKKTDARYNDKETGIQPSIGKKLHVIHFWSWYQTACWDASHQKLSAGSFPNVMQGFDAVLSGNPRRGPYQRLLLQMFQTMEMSKLTGGLSGSLVLKVQPIDMDSNRRLDPCIVKLDKADAILHEVVNSKRVYNVLSDRAARTLSNAVFFTDPETNVEYGAFKLELAAGCWQIPEVASSDIEDLLSTVRDLVVYECECHHPSAEEFQKIPLKAGRADQRRPFGSTDAVIDELIGPGGMLCNMQQEGLLRSAYNLLDTFACGMMGKDTQYNPFCGSANENETPGIRMRPLLAAFAKKHFMDVNDSGEELPDVRAAVLQLIDDWTKKMDVYTPLIALAHGDINMRNVLIDAMDAVWLIDFAFSRDLPLCWDLAKVEISFLFEYSILPVSPSTLLGFAGATKEEWIKNKAAAWLDVEEEVAITFFEWLQKGSIEDACSHAAQKTEFHLQTARKLRAHLCTEEEEKMVFQYAAKLIPALLEGETLPDVLTKAPVRVLGLEGSSHSSCVAPLSLLVHHIMRFRRLFMDHWVHMLVKYRDEKQQRLSREGGCEASNRLVKGDFKAKQLWFALLQESHRLLGYFDISPWHKTWVVFFVRKLVELLRGQLDNTDSLDEGSLESLDIGKSTNSQTSEWKRDVMDEVSVEHLIAAKECVRKECCLPQSLCTSLDVRMKELPEGRNFSRVRQVHWDRGVTYGSFTLDAEGDLCKAAPQFTDDITICCPQGSHVRLLVISGSIPDHWRYGVVTDLSDGIYTVQYDVNLDISHPSDHPKDLSASNFGERVRFDPRLNNHLICPVLNYSPWTELLFYMNCGRSVSALVLDAYGSQHCLRINEQRRTPTESKKPSPAIYSTQGSLEMGDYWVTLVPENHCLTVLPYAEFEEQLIKFRMFSKARFSSTMDVISGESIDALGSLYSVDIKRRKVTAQDGEAWADCDFCVRRVSNGSESETSNNWAVLCDFIMNPRESVVCGHLLFGVPGSGKSCIIRKLIMYCLNGSKQAVPVLLSPRVLSQRAAALPLGSTAPEGLQLISWYLQLIYGENSPRYAALRQVMNAHRVVFFIDGIDEASEELQPALSRCLEELVALDHRVIVTARNLDNVSAELGLFAAWEVLPLSASARCELVKSRLRPPQWTEEDARTCLAFVTAFCTRLSPEECTSWHIPIMISVLIVYWREKMRKPSGRKSSKQISSETTRARAPSLPGSTPSTPPSDGFDYDIRDVYRVALDVLLKRVHGTNQADRHAVAVQVEEFKSLLGCIAMDMKNEVRNSFTEQDALFSEATISDSETPKVWFGLKRLVHKGYFPLLRYDHDKQSPVYRFACHSFAEFLAYDGEERSAFKSTMTEDFHSGERLSADFNKEEGLGFTHYLKSSVLSFFHAGNTAEDEGDASRE